MDLDLDQDLDLKTESGVFAVNNTTQLTAMDDKQKPTRRKFAIPPVKVACLECRASRCRCDGNPVQCSNCTNKGKKCIYVQSKRGGSRIRKRKVSPDTATPPANNRDLNQAAFSVLPELDQATFAGPLSFVSPGGGLRQLDLLPEETETEFCFDRFLQTQDFQDLQDSGYETSEYAGTISPGNELTFTPIRAYSSDDAILSAYYTFIHPYFPVLPPPVAHQVVDNVDYGFKREPDAIYTSAMAPDFEPSSPLSLAISATLALIPHPDDPNPAESVKIRREQAKAFAQCAYDEIETESEILESNYNPAEALSTEPAPHYRQPFHPQNPIENESIIALILLSTFEYAQRGNVTKMRNRAGQALNAAMDLKLHAKGNEESFYAEANRRVWWMTYIIACQGAILSNSTPPMLLYDPRFTTAHPTFAMDTESWSVFLKSQQVITNATQFVVDLDASLKLNGNVTDMWDRMIELDAIIEPLVTIANSWKDWPQATLDGYELCVGQALRCMARIKLNSARIKLHRFCAFADMPVFSKKHCDLKTSTPINSPQCGCTTTFQGLPNGFNQSPAPDSASSLPKSSAVFPFSTAFSTTVCFRSAFNIADSYQKLPYPQPVRSHEPLPGAWLQKNKVPRMIPIFSCCAMQSSYVMIMLSYKAKSMGFLSPSDDGGSNQASMLEQLQKGLGMVLDALRNYSLAYEGLSGMRDQVELAVQSLATNDVLPHHH